MEEVDGEKGEECLQKATQTLFRRREKGGLKKETKLFSSTMLTCQSQR